MALSRHHAPLARPLSIQEITTEAQNFDFSVNQPMKQWIRAGKMLLTEAAICEQDGNLQMAYLYLYRHAELFLQKLPQHPDYRDPRFKEDLAQARRALKANMAKLEQMKPEISRVHQRYLKAVERRNAERRRVESEREPVDDRRPSTHGSSLSEDGGFDDDGRTLKAGEHSELAVDLAHREIRRRVQSRQTTRQAGISPGTIASRRRGLVLGETDADGLIDERNGGRKAGADDGVREAGRYLHAEDRRDHRGDALPSRRTTTHIYNYPSVPTKEDAINWKMPSLQPGGTQTSTGLPPARPAKQSIADNAPPIPPRLLDSRSPSPTPAIPSSPPTSKYTFKPTAFTEAGAPLRTVLLPPDLRTTFLNLAHPNTLHNLETCGILGGTLIANALFINHLIIPDQHSTSDTCDTTETGDNALFDYCDAADLLVCGWIHTHPTQSCFLSSRDLHTSSGYQIMLPEAISIVCAPKHNPEWGIFRLTDPPGLQAVLQCREKGLFHPHKEGNLYTDALRPGHVVEGKGLKFEVVDLRGRA